jgi:hypothetical protein
VGTRDVLVPEHNLLKLIEVLPKNNMDDISSENQTPYVNIKKINDYNHLDLIWAQD